MQPSAPPHVSIKPLERKKNMVLPWFLCLNLTEQQAQRCDQTQKFNI